MADLVIQEAYGYLWQIETDDERVHQARRLLLSLIDKDGQRNGIANTRPMECGHPISLGCNSAETGEFLFCAFCDTQSQLRDAENQEALYLRQRDEARSELASLKSERDEMRKALTPFAEDADAWASSVPDDYCPKCCEPGKTYAHPGSETKFSVGDLRRAARAIKGEA